MLLNNQWIIEEIKEEIKRYTETNDMKIQHPKPMGHSRSSSEREFYINTLLSQEIKKSSNKQLKLISETSREGKIDKVQNYYKERNHKE